MRYKDFYDLLGAAQEEPERDRYLSEWSSSDIFYPDPDTEGPGPEEVTATLQNIWDVAHLSVKDIRAKTGLSQAAFAVRFCVSLRTVQNWEGRGTCPAYIRLLMAESVGMVTVKRER